jgi:glycosyltransferase involved in cell wall biosynthesis
VGTFDVEKNLGLALACLGELEDGYELHLFGTGPEETRLRALAASLGVARRVHWHGWVADPERVWRGIDLLLFPSLREGSPNAVLEALACGIPVLALRVDELAEILPASTLAPDAPGAWAAKVRDWRNRLADVAGEQSRYAMRLNYDWDRAVVDALISPPTHGSSGQSSGQSSG